MTKNVVSPRKAAEHDYKALRILPLLLTGLSTARRYLKPKNLRVRSEESAAQAIAGVGISDKASNPPRNDEHTSLVPHTNFSIEHETVTHIWRPAIPAAAKEATGKGKAATGCDVYGIDIEMGHA